MATLATLVASCSNRTVEVKDITLRDGTIQRIEVVATRGPDIFGVKAPPDKVEVSFERNRRHYHWQLERLPGEDWVSPPEIIDFVDSEPVIVFAVHRRPSCEAWGFPREGLVAQRFNGQGWERVSIEDLPADLQPVRRGMTTSSKRRRGDSLAEMVAFHREYDDSCEELNPSPATRAALAALMGRVSASPVGVVQPVAMTDIPPVERDRLFASSQRTWSSGYIGNACTGLIDEIDGFAVLTGPVPAVDEVRWAMLDGIRKRVQVPSGFVSVFCEADSVFLVSEPFSGEMVWFIRFSRDAEFIESVRFPVKGIRARTPGVISAVSFDSGHLYFLWSELKDCTTAGDSNCQAYSVTWREVGETRS